MVDRSPPQESLRRRWHTAVEAYTPDGSLGRFLLGSVTGLFGFWFLLLVLVEPVAVPVALFLIALSIPQLLLSITVCWPVYLSLIGNLESADEYALGRDEDERDGEDPVDVLKRRYANGEISESEFERRLDTLIGSDVPGDRTRSRSRRDRKREYSTETDR